ncbi:MAG TPA: acetate--CoA ligase family protein, partial [Acidimicrobiales bacterium]|nr:acetate--CoA ligase family protein [Acidimicrobiales bacterium]
AAGLACPRRLTTPEREQAQEALGRLRPPLVVKVCDAGVAHKSEVGGVRTGVVDRAGLAAALDAVAAVPPTGHRRRYLVEEEAPGGVELIIGGRRDPSFGPVVLVGLGGLVAEAVGDVALRLAPVGVADVEEMVAELTGAAVLGGFRGMAPVDPGEVAGILGVVSALLTGEGGVEEVDLNPVRATAGGLVVLDALVVGHGADPSGVV